MFARSMGASTVSDVKRSSSCQRTHRDTKAKTGLGSEAEIETRIATLRARRTVRVSRSPSSTPIALAGRWYTWFVGQHENDPGPAKRWHEMVTTSCGT